MAGYKHWIWLCGMPIGTGKRFALLRHFQTPEDVYYAAEDDLLQVEGMGLAEAKLLQNKDLSEADRILGVCAAKNISLLTIQDAVYPNRLKNIYDPPLLLYMQGSLPEVDEGVTVSVVGTRRATPYGEWAAEKIAYGLASGGATVVSGLARGIDTAATRGALRAGGRPIAVLGCGVDVVYPTENRFLYEDVAAHGALISEYPPGTEPRAEHFPVRNRIIAGLSLGTLVVEAPQGKSGALITAQSALEQGRDVFAVPGPIGSETSGGCHALIREGAILVTDAVDILREYEAMYPVVLPKDKEPDPLGATEEKRRPASAEPAMPTVDLTKERERFTDDQLALLSLLSETESRHTDDIIEESGLSARRVLSALTRLVLEDCVAEDSGKRFRRTVHIKE